MSDVPSIEIYKTLLRGLQGTWAIRWKMAVWNKNKLYDSVNWFTAEYLFENNKNSRMHLPEQDAVISRSFIYSKGVLVNIQGYLK